MVTSYYDATSSPGDYLPKIWPFLPKVPLRGDMVVVNLYSPRTKNAFSPLLRKTVRTSAASVHGAGPGCLRWLSGMDELAAAMEVAAMSLDSDFEEDLEQPSCLD